MRFKADLRAEAWNVEMQIGYHEQVQANGRRAADALSNRKPLSDEALLVAAFRRLVPHGVQGALETTCGDRVVPSGDYAGIATKLDYPCRVDLPPAEVAAAAHALRSDPAILPLLNQRIVDLGTNIGNLTFYDADSIRKNLRAIVLKKP